MATQEVSKGVRLSEGVTLAAVPFLGFAYAFAYELGYVYEFQIPYWLIEVSLPNALAVGSALLLAIMVLGQLLSLLPRGPWHAVVLPLLETVMSGAMLPMGISLVRSVDKHSSNEQVIAAWTILGVAIAILIVGVLRSWVSPLVRNSGNWLERLEVRLNKVVAQDKRDAQSAVVEFLDRQGFNASTYQLLGWLILVVIPLAFALLGHKVAENSFRFLVATGKGECILVRRYGDLGYCANFVRGPVRLDGQLQVFDLGKDLGQTFRVESLGPVQWLPVSEAERIRGPLWKEPSGPLTRQDQP